MSDKRAHRQQFLISRKKGQSVILSLKELVGSRSTGGGESRMEGGGVLGIDASERGGETEGGCSRTMSRHGGEGQGEIDSQVLLTL